LNIDFAFRLYTKILSLLTALFFEKKPINQNLNKNQA
jgi:hypothetical protein